MLVAAGLGMAAEHALISLLALNGLRVSEATGADIQALGVERGHRTLTITRKGGKVATIPLAPRTARAIDLAIGERPEGPIFLAPGRAAAGSARRRAGPPDAQAAGPRPDHAARRPARPLPPARHPARLPRTAQLTDPGLCRGFHPVTTGTQA